jgi:hypothetical protein
MDRALVGDLQQVRALVVGDGPAMWTLRVSA